MLFIFRPSRTGPASPRRTCYLSSRRVPRALPWAELSRPFRAKNNPLNVARRNTVGGNGSARYPNIFNTPEYRTPATRRWIEKPTGFRRNDSHNTIDRIRPIVHTCHSIRNTPRGLS